jgi:predicted amidohydrolase
VRVALISDGDWRQRIRAARAGGADVICMPQLSFAPYVPAVRDRAGLELAERAPAGSLREAVALADGAWLSASAYESEGEGVFYVTAALARAGGPMLRHRQQAVEAGHGRYEQMFFSPGHDDPSGTVELPWGPTGTLVGAEVRDPRLWADLAAAGAATVLGGVSEPADLWAGTQRILAGMAAAHAIRVLVANRGGREHGVCFAGGSIALAPGGERLPVRDDMVELP